MKILHVVPWYEPAWATGGTASATSMLCRELTSQGTDVTVYTTNDAGEGKYLDCLLDTEINQGGVKTYYFPCGLTKHFKWKAAAFSKVLSKKLIKNIEKFDLVHIGATRHWHGVTVKRLCKKFNIPYIITPHASLTEWGIKNIGNLFLKKIYTYLVDSKVIKRSAAIHYLCEEERRLSSKYDYASSSFIIPNGIQIDDYKKNITLRNELRKINHIAQDDFVLSSLGRIHPIKNIHIVIESFRELAKEHKNIYYFIIGPVADEKYYGYLKKIIKNYNLDNVVRFIPPVDQSEVIKWYSFSDLLAMPSVIEGISMTLIEALSCSLPVMVSSNVANFRELENDDAGIIVEQNSDSITKNLSLLLSSPDRLKQIADNALHSARTRYNIKNVASLMMQAYDNILTGKKTKEASHHKSGIL